MLTGKYSDAFALTIPFTLFSFTSGIKTSRFTTFVEVKIKITFLLLIPLLSNCALIALAILEASLMLPSSYASSGVSKINALCTCVPFFTEGVTSTIVILSFVMSIVKTLLLFAISIASLANQKFLIGSYTQHVQIPAYQLFTAYHCNINAQR